VTVQVRNTGTNEITTVITDDQGNYSAPLLKPGTYSISAEQTGFKKFQQDGIELSINQVATANIALEVGQLTDQVTVTAGVEILELSTANRGSVIDNQQVREFPLNARNPFMLGMLVAGVNFNGASIWQRPFDNGAIAEWTINGRAGGNNIALVIQTNTYDAQYGKTTGGIINVSLRSGGNDFHGTLYEFARREQWDANDFRINARNQPKPLHYLEQYGGQIQGPVIFPKLYNGRDKTFFMFNYEGYRESSGSADSFGSGSGNAQRRLQQTGRRPGTADHHLRPADRKGRRQRAGRLGARPVPRKRNPLDPAQSDFAEDPQLPAQAQHEVARSRLLTSESLHPGQHRRGRFL
jgi:hypothetical protein